MQAYGILFVRSIQQSWYDIYSLIQAYYVLFIRSIHEAWFDSYFPTLAYYVLFVRLTQGWMLLLTTAWLLRIIQDKFYFVLLSHLTLRLNVLFFIELRCYFG